MSLEHGCADRLSIVHWEMMEYLPIKTVVVLHAIATGYELTGSR